MKMRAPSVAWGFLGVLGGLGPAAAGILHDNQDPSLGYGVAVLSEIAGIHQVGDDFVLARPSTFQKVEWWGESGGTEFAIRVFGFDGGTPSSEPLADWNVSVVGTPQDFFGQTYLRYLVAVPDLYLSAGTYLLSIVDLEPEQTWFWAASCEDGCEGQSWGRSLDGDPWTTGNFAFAFRVLGTPELALGAPDVCYGSTGLADGGRLLQVDLQTGAGTLVTDLPGVGQMPALAVDAAGRIHGVRDGVDSDSLCTVDAVTGETCCAPIAGHAAIAFAPDGVLWGLDGTTLRTIDPVCATTTDAGVLDLPDAATGMAFDPLDGSLWVCTSAALLKVDPMTPATQLVGTSGAGAMTDLVFDGTGNLYAAAGDVLVSLDKSTGAATPIGSIGFAAVGGLASLPTVPAASSPARHAIRELAVSSSPNPFRPGTMIGFELPRAGRATVEVFDVRGRLVRRLLDAELEAGAHSVRWNATDDAGRPAAPGLYFYRVRADGTQGVGRVAHVR